MRAYERLLRYIAVPTPSDESSDSHPSSEAEFDLARLLVTELQSLGAADAYCDEHCYVYGHIPASTGLESAPAVGLIAHMDTVQNPASSGSRTPAMHTGSSVPHAPHPQIIENYGGGDVSLGESGLILSPTDFPDLLELTGHTLITTDGTTILGADDKAGIAEIMTALEQLPHIDHGPVSIAFTPDEEIGHGTDDFDLEAFQADFAYTLDGESVGEVQYESFNAAAATVRIRGNSVHPGSAKGVMINAGLLGMEFSALLPPDQRPECTDGYEGFIHLTSSCGDVESSELHYILRDHDASKLELKKGILQGAALRLNEKYGDVTVSLELQDQYRNMAEVLKDRPEILDLARQACLDTGVQPISIPIRGGTDGAILSFRGLPCPNLGTGAHGFHGPYEHVSAEDMDQSVQVVLRLLELAANQ